VSVPACPPRIKVSLFLRHCGRSLDPRRARGVLLSIAGMSLSAHPAREFTVGFSLSNPGLCDGAISARAVQHLPRRATRLGLTFGSDIANGSTRSPENLKCEEPMQNKLPTKRPHFRRVLTHCRRVAIPSLALLAALPVYAQSTSDPWDNAVTVLKTAFTGTIATGLSLVAIVVGGLMFAYGEGQSKKTLAGIVFGVGMAVGAVNFMAWLFPS
jgi:type IV secretion system protein TrbC